MILINTKTNQGYSNVSKEEASRMIGVCSATILRWSKKRSKEEYHHWVIYFSETKLKQPKGNVEFLRLKTNKNKM